MVTVALTRAVAARLPDALCMTLAVQSLRFVVVGFTVGQLQDILLSTNGFLSAILVLLLCSKQTTAQSLTFNQLLLSPQLLLSLC